MLIKVTEPHPPRLREINTGEHNAGLTTERIQTGGFMKNSTKVFAVSALAGALGACGGSGSDGGSTGQTGTVSVGLTDAPVDHAEAVNIEVTALVLKHQDGSPVRYEIGRAHV